MEATIQYQGLTLALPTFEQIVELAQKIEANPLNSTRHFAALDKWSLELDLRLSVRN